MDSEEGEAAVARAATQAIERTEESQSVRSRQRWLTLIITAAALYLARSFLAPVAWAAVLAVSLWPLYTRLLRAMPGRSGLVGALFALATAVLVMIPLAIVAAAAVGESQGALAWVQEVTRTGIAAPAWLGSLPLVGGRALGFWQSHIGSPQAAGTLLGGVNAGAVFGYTRTIGGQVANGIVLFLITLLALFGMLVRGRALADQARTVSRRALGAFGLRFTNGFANAVRGTVTGTVLVAVGEGTLIGIGYWVAGVPRPLLFAILTIFVAMLPFGAWFAFSLATIILLVQGHLIAAALLFGFSIAIMFVGDNIIQPALIGSSVRLPFIFALLGTFGGLETFGLVGLFLGPAIMSALLLTWDQWVEGSDSAPSDEVVHERATGAGGNPRARPDAV